MAKVKSLSFSVLPSILIINTALLLLCNATEDEKRKDYIVYLGSLPKGDYAPSSHHSGLLQQVLKDSPAANVLIRSYKRSFNGFAAKLTPEEAQNLARRKEVVSVFPSTNLQLQTTQSWDFMGFSEASTKSPRMASDIIVGVIDSGVWPESESFSDEGFGPPPKKWKGACHGGTNFTCNKKLIGARYYSQRPYHVYDSARDDVVGHGTHTASIVAGNIVEDVSFYGLAKGSARGGLPSSRIAAYKVCDAPDVCQTSSILAAFDDAIADGVDIISISIGWHYGVPFEDDVIAIGAFHAVAKGILTVQSAGNDGSLGLTGSVAPWKLSVAASTLNRRFITKIVLGNGKTLVGASLNSFSLNGTKFPLIKGEDAASKQCSQGYARSCMSGCLDSNLVKGKIVICEDSSGGDEAKRSGATGVITPPDTLDVHYVVPFPQVSLGNGDFSEVKSYADSTKSAEGEILKSEAINDFEAPTVATFSSRGPNAIAPDILKPDVSAPGVDILAAYPPILPLTGSPGDSRRVKYTIMSGTSMACPHVAGVAAYVKATHPDWSPSAIKSAIMTTAWTMNATKSQWGEFAYGSGHIDPTQAINPGLVYEASRDDYIKFLCSLGYDADKVRTITGDSSSCPAGSSKGSPKDLNYPSMAAKTSSQSESFEIVFHRTVTNVGLAKSTYRVNISSSPKLKIKVVPEVLSFNSLKENKSFTVTVAGGGLSTGTMESASLVWSDGKHSVRSPIVVYNIGLKQQEHTFALVKRRIMTNAERFRGHLTIDVRCPWWGMHEESVVHGFMPCGNVFRLGACGVPCRHKFIRIVSSILIFTSSFIRN
ncbi:hypothetical protein Tsubulata_044067 [Turnera subulata]|uniref:Uncharacterized protein n=1 Tax=Turnera subulata TaxID=218843 RepID=A0A9Q0GCH9_9ROSI|nr:hypothetical protein Tsubulata_044067 [Turnera subulata]